MNFIKHALLNLILLVVVLALAFLLPAHSLNLKEEAPIVVIPASVTPTPGIDETASGGDDSASSAPPVKQVPFLPLDFEPAPKPGESGFIDYGYKAPSTDSRKKTPYIAESDVYAYEDSSITVKISKERYEGQDCTIADIKIGHPSQLRTAFAGGVYNSSNREYLSDLARRQNAVVAVNGDFYGYRKDGVIFRQGSLYRDKPSVRDLLIIDAQGDFHIIHEKDFKLADWSDKGPVNSFSFGPALVIDGELAQIPKEKDYPEGYMENQHPRTAIGQVDKLHYILVTVDGLVHWSMGIKVKPLAEFMKSKGCTQAYNLDGGQSTVMTFNNKVVNHVAYNGERKLCDVVYFATAIDPSYKGDKINGN
ncbi:MAG: phosphodiester glycosidase family protein [Oscillospiraceae bacterium]|jgi:exopolysaccharide biosynthesis protein|nr:phosphodiester glycosidase family protein [Oscillospiraceae bacterium]